MARLRVAVCADFPEEGWRSMDRVAAMLVDSLQRHHAATIQATLIVPGFVRRVTRVWPGRSRWPRQVDRILNRLLDYPRYATTISGDYDVFHVVDHSYSHLVHRLPAGRTIVTCHDLDAFRSILHPDAEPRTAPYRAMSRHIMAGLRQAARLTCDTAAIRNELLSHGLAAPDRVLVAPVGVGEPYSPSPDPAIDARAARLVGSAPGSIELLHVGSPVARKRIDLLLKFCGELRRHVPELHLIRAGGAFTAEQQKLARDVGMQDHMSVLEFLDDRTLAAVYRRAAIVVQPSDREGFGLPLVEAMACGTPVIATDLSVLREVGGTAVEYCAPGDQHAWTARLLELLHERRDAPERWAARREAGLARAARFTWQQFAARLVDVYAQLAATSEPELAVHTA